MHLCEAHKRTRCQQQCLCFQPIVQSAQRGLSTKKTWEIGRCFESMSFQMALERKNRDRGSRRPKQREGKSNLGQIQLRPQPESSLLHNNSQSRPAKICGIEILVVVSWGSSVLWMWYWEGKHLNFTTHPYLRGAGKSWYARSLEYWKTKLWDSDSISWRSIIKLWLRNWVTLKAFRPLLLWSGS